MVHLQIALKNIEKHIVDIARLAESNVKIAISSFLSLDPKQAEEIIKNDKKIDEEEVRFEEECLKVLALNQPLARDLRIIIAYLKINNDLERIGDLAVNIARKTKYLASQKDSVELNIKYDDMCSRTMEMLKMSIEILNNVDIKKAKKILKSDDKINKLKKSFKNEILKSMKSNPDSIDKLLRHHAFVRALERIADMTTNIAEDIIYVHTGNIIRHGLDKDYLED